MRWIDTVQSVRLGSSDLDMSIRFATQILGLQLVRRDSQRAYLRASGGRDHHVVYVRGDARRESLAFGVAPGARVDDVVAALGRSGERVREGTRAECDERAVHTLYLLNDPTGNAIEIVSEQETRDEIIHSRDAGITSFSHVGLRTTDAPRDEAFWTQRLGARVSDWIGQAPLLRLDDVHHRLALFPSSRPGIQHVNFQVAGIDDVMRSFYFLTSRNVPIVFGPGRHPTSSAIFLYFQGPDDIVYEYSTGVRLIADEVGHEPRRFPFAPSSFCMWGSRPDIPEFRVPSVVAGDEPLLRAAQGCR